MKHHQNIFVLPESDIIWAPHYILQSWMCDSNFLIWEQHPLLIWILMNNENEHKGSVMGDTSICLIIWESWKYLEDMKEGLNDIGRPVLFGAVMSHSQLGVVVQVWTSLSGNSIIHGPGVHPLISCILEYRLQISVDAWSSATCIALLGDLDNTTTIQSNLIQVSMPWRSPHYVQGKLLVIMVMWLTGNIWDAY